MKDKLENIEIEDFDLYVKRIVKELIDSKDKNYIKNERASNTSIIKSGGDTSGNESVQSVESVCDKNEGNI